MTPDDIEHLNNMPSIPRFSYTDYENLVRAPEYEQLHAMSRANAALFEGRRRVLDLASGQGFLLDALREQGVASYGVEIEAELAADCLARGLAVEQDDVLHFLATTPERFDGVNCAHLIEHFPFSRVIDLIEGVRRVLTPGGVFVLRWPNPRSLEMQHLSFWRDPTHVQFYDGQTMQAMLIHYGFQIQTVHYDTVAPRRPWLPQDASKPPPPAQRPSSLLRRIVKNTYLLVQNSPLQGTASARWLKSLRERRRLTQQYQARMRLLLDLPLEAQILAERA